MYYMIVLQGCKQVGRFIFFKVKEIVPIYFTQFSARSNIILQNKTSKTKVHLFYISRSFLHHVFLVGFFIVKACQLTFSLFSTKKV